MFDTYDVILLIFIGYLLGILTGKSYIFKRMWNDTAKFSPMYHIEKLTPHHMIIERRK